MSENPQLDANFVNFVRGQVNNVKSPMNLSKLCRKFKKKSGTSSSDRKLLMRLRRIRDRMSEMDHIDIDTKVKMIFALGSPVSNGLLIELREQADIELDEQHRIVKYKKNGNDLQLSGKHIGRCHLNNIGMEKKMMKFLALKSENATSPMADNAFLKEFNSSKESYKVEGYTYARYYLLKQQIYLTPEFNQETKIKMIFVSSTKIHASILEELRKNAVVEVDEHNRITKYEANDGSLKLESKLSPPFTIWSKEEEDKLMKFIAERAKQTNIPRGMKDFSREFAEKNGVSRTKIAVRLYIHRHLVSKISKLDSFDIETRMRMLFALSSPVDQEFLNKLRKNAVVKIDEKRRITKYKAKNGSLELDGDHNWLAKVKAGRAQKTSKNRISESSENEEETDDDDDEVDEEEDVEEEVSNPNTRSGRLSKKRLSDNHFCSDSDDSSCESSEKVENSKNERKEKITRKSRNTYISDTDEETEEEEEDVEEGDEEVDTEEIDEKEEGDEDEEEVSKEKEKKNKDHIGDSENDDEGEEEKSDDKDEDVENEFEEIATRRDRVLKRRTYKTNTSNKENEYHMEVDDYDIPYQRDDENRETETVAQNDAKKRREVEFEVDFQTQNLSEELMEMRSERVDEPPEDVIYEGPGEPPLPVLLPRKRETIEEQIVVVDDNNEQRKEQKPDTTRVINTSNEFKREDLEFGDVPDNLSSALSTTSSMTASQTSIDSCSSIKFLKMIRNLVRALESPILVALQEKIDSKIAELRRNDVKVAIKSVIQALESAVHLVQNHASMTLPTTNSTSFKEFLLILRAATFNLTSPELVDLQKELKDFGNQIEHRNKRVSFEKIQNGLEYAIAYVIS